MKQFLKMLAAILGVATVYFYSGKLGLSLALVHVDASAVWPPTGLALAALLLGGYRLWPAIFIGSFLVDMTTQGLWASSVGIATGDTLEALVGAALVRRLAGGLNCFERSRTAFRFVLLAAMISTMISATVGVISLGLLKEASWAHCWTVWSTWWIGNMTSDLLIAPLLLIWGSQRPPRWKAARLAEGVLLALTLVSVGGVVFLGGNPFAATEQLEYLTIPPLLWAAFRFGMHGATAAAVTTSGLALWGTLHRMGPFLTADPNETLLLLQTFTGVVTATVLVLAAVISERARFQSRLELKDALSRILTEATSVRAAARKILEHLCTQSAWAAGVLWEVDRGTQRLFCSEVWHADNLDISAFEIHTRALRCAPGIGLPGRIWQAGKPLWTPALMRDDASPRAAAATQAGLHAALGFPLQFGNETLGVMEFFRREFREPENDFIQMLIPLGQQLGLFMERKLAEVALRASEERYRLVVEDQTETICRFKADGTFTYVNETYCRLFGRTRAELLGNQWQPSAAKEDLPEIEKQLRKLTPANRVVTIENRIYTDTGELRWFQFVNRAFFDADGVLIETQSVGRDITERKRAEASLRDSELRFKQVTESIQEVFWVVNAANTEMIYISPAYENIWGRTCASLYASPQDWLQAVHPEDHDRVQHAYRISPTRGDYDEEYRIIRPDGAVRWIRARSFAVPDASGKVYRFAGIAEDITARKQAEFKLALLAHGVESTSEFICITNLQNRFVFANPAFLKAFGYEPGEILGKTPEMLFSPNNPPRLMLEILKQSHAGGWSGEVLDLRKDGTEFPIFLRTSQIKDHHGEVIALMGVADDISTRKQAEQVLIASEARLRMITEQVPATIWTLDLDLKFTSSTGLALTSLNLKNNEVVGRSLTEVFGDTQEAPPRIAAHRRALNGERTAYEATWGGRMWRINLEPLSDRGGKIIGCIGAAFDITESKLTEARLKELADIVASSRDAIIRLNLERHIVIWNQGAVELFGYSAAEAVGKHISILMPPDRADEAIVIRDKINQFELAEIPETVRRCKDGTLRDVSLKISPMIDPDGRLMGSAAIIRDITERKRLEKMLLEISANERRRIGYDLHDGLGQHLAGTAFKAKALEETLAAESSPHAEAAGKLVSLINGGISQTRALAQGLDPVDLEMAGLPAALQKLAAQTAEQFRVIGDFHCNQEQLQLQSPVGLTLFRIAQESIHNAINHGKATQLTISLEVASESLELTVRDNGKGFQVQGKTGSGMGLRIMHYRANAIGARLTIRSAPGSGTAIFLSVPQQSSLI